MKTTLVLLAIVPIILIQVYRTNYQLQSESEKVVHLFEDKSKLKLLTSLLSTPEICIESLKGVDLSNIKTSPVIVKDKDWTIEGRSLSEIFELDSNNTSDIYISHIEDISDSKYNVSFSLKTNNEDSIAQKSLLKAEIEEDSSKAVIGCKMFKNEVIDVDVEDANVEFKKEITLNDWEAACFERKNPLGSNLGYKLHVKDLGDSYEVKSCFYETSGEVIFCEDKVLSDGDTFTSDKDHLEPVHSENIYLRLATQVTKIGVQVNVSFMLENSDYSSCMFGTQAYWAIKK